MKFFSIFTDKISDDLS